MPQNGLQTGRDVSGIGEDLLLSNETERRRHGSHPLTRNKCLTTSNKKLLGTSALLVVTIRI